MPSREPPTTTVAPAATVSSTIRCTRSICFSLIIGPSATSPAAGLPTGRRAARSVSAARYSSAIDSCTRCRLTARQIWPWCRNEPHAPADEAASMSASSSTISGQLPPSSSTTRFSPRPAVSPTTRPVFVDPVNEIIRTFGSSTSAWPTSGPPQKTCRTPDGRPASSKMRAMITPPRHGRVRVALEHDRVPQHERRAERPHRQHDREVPGRDHADDADRHAAGGRRPSREPGTAAPARAEPRSARQPR